MKSPKEIAEQHFEAFHGRNEERLRELLHPEYTFKGPSFELGSPDESIAFMKAMPFKATRSNFEYITEGDVVVHRFDLLYSEPETAEVPMCEIIRIRDGRIHRIELYYDSAAVPQA